MRGLAPVQARDRQQGTGASNRGNARRHCRRQGCSPFWPGIVSASSPSSLAHPSIFYRRRSFHNRHCHASTGVGSSQRRHRAPRPVASDRPTPEGTGENEAAASRCSTDCMQSEATDGHHPLPPPGTAGPKLVAWRRPWRRLAADDFRVEPVRRDVDRRRPEGVETVCRKPPIAIQNFT